MDKKPSGWSTFAELARNEADLQRQIRIRLIELVFTQDNATAVRAVELLNQMESAHVEDDLRDLPLELLYEIERRAVGYIEEFANSEAGRPESGNGTGAEE